MPTREYICKTCGCTFLKSDKSSHANFYCSLDCRDGKPNPIPPKICPVCKKQFRSCEKRRKYCSRECFEKQRKAQVEKRICIVCKDKFDFRLNSQHSGQFCSWSCYIESKRTDIVECPNCRTEFKQQYSKQIFCNRQCYLEYNAADPSQPSPRQTKVICDHCGKKFLKWRYRIKSNKENYCSRECAARSLVTGKTMATKNCQVCNKTFETPTWHLENRKYAGKYCSRDCQAKAFSLKRRGSNNPMWRGGHEQDYGPEWPAARRKARRRDNYICRHCHKKPKKRYNLHVHHIIPFKEFGYIRGVNNNDEQANALQNLLCLCRPCHVRADAGKLAVQAIML